VTIQQRLALLYTLILVLTVSLFSVIVYAIQARDSLEIQQHVLAEVTRRLAPTDTVVPETYVQWMSLDGALLGRSAGLGVLTLPLSDAGWEAVRDGQSWSEVARLGRKTVLVYSQPVISGQVPRVLQVARSLAERNQALSDMRQAMVISGALLAILAFGLGTVLARAGLEPVNRITEAAAAIGKARDFSRRVHYEGPDDEIGQLVQTFDAMLEELEAAHRRTEEALRAQRRFVADASHELRTPLTTIRGNLELLRRAPPIHERDRVGVLADLVDETERLIRLVTDLLTLARIDAQRTLHPRPTAVSQVVQAVCRQIQAVAPRRQIACEAADATALADPDALRQILLILLDNALKHTPPDAGIQIKVAQADHRVLIHVGDEGPGIPPDAVPHLFNRFYRLDAARSGPGTGLGLAIAEALVQAQGGEIAVESTEGQGTIFIVALPASR
jgi:signal transduction histidine kinase